MIDINKNIKAVKSGIWYTLSNFMVKGIIFITTPIFTRILTKREFGIYNNYASWLAIITIIVTLNLESTLISAKFDFKKQFDKYILSILSLSALSTIIWCVVINVFYVQFTKLFGLERKYMNIMLVYLFFLPAVNIFQAREQYNFRYKKTVVISMLLSISTTILSIVLVITMENKVYGRILGSVIPTVIIGLIIYLFFIKREKINIHYWKYALPICIPYIPHLLSMTLLNSTDRVMIDKICGSEATAIYSLAYLCGSIVTLFLTSLNSAYAPWLGEKLEDNDYKSITQFSKMYVVCFFVLGIGIMLISPEILYVLGGSQYMDAKYVLAPVSMGCVCQFLYTLYVNIEQFKKKTFGMAIASMIAAVVNMGLNYWLIPQYGYLAAAYTTLVGYIILLFIHMFLVWKMGMGQIYNNKFNLLIVAIGVFSTVLITLLYKFPVLRYMSILLYSIFLLTILVYNRGLILKFIRERKN